MTDQPTYQQPNGTPAGWPGAQRQYPLQPQPQPQPQPRRSPIIPALVGGLVGGAIGLFVGAVGCVFALIILPNTSMPASLGEDPHVDEVYDMCADGDMAACDLMFYEVAPGSVLEDFSMSCGDRVANPERIYCTDLNPTGDSGSLDLNA